MYYINQFTLELMAMKMPISLLWNLEIGRPYNRTVLIFGDEAEIVAIVVCGYSYIGEIIDDVTATFMKLLRNRAGCCYHWYNQRIGLRMSAI